MTDHKELAPYGEIATETGQTTLLNGFTDKYLDAESNFSYFGNRYFLPGVGRWASADPAFSNDLLGKPKNGDDHQVGLGDRQRITLWGFCNDSPVTNADLAGEKVINDTNRPFPSALTATAAYKALDAAPVEIRVKLKSPSGMIQKNGEPVVGETHPYVSNAGTPAQEVKKIDVFVNDSQVILNLADGSKVKDQITYDAYRVTAERVPLSGFGKKSELGFAQVVAHELGHAQEAITTRGRGDEAQGHVSFSARYETQVLKAAGITPGDIGQATSVLLGESNK